MLFQFLLKAQWLGDLGWLNDVYKVLPSILYAILALVGGAGAVYSIVLGVNLAKSENDEKRRYAAYRLRNTLIGVGILLVLVLFINLGLPAILKAAYGEKGWGEPPTLEGALYPASLLMNLLTF